MFRLLLISIFRICFIISFIPLLHITITIVVCCSVESVHFRKSWLFPTHCWLYLYHLLMSTCGVLSLFMSTLKHENFSPDCHIFSYNGGHPGYDVILYWKTWTLKVLTYIEYRAVSGVFRTIDPPPPLHPASVSSPRTKGGGRTHLPVGEGVVGQYFGRRQTLD